jgi:hypothetical protein
MAITALTSFYVLVSTATTSGTAPGGASAPTGCTLSGTTADISAFVSQLEAGADVATQDITTYLRVGRLHRVCRRAPFWCHVDDGV